MQRLNHLAVELDRCDAGYLGREPQRQRPGAGSNLDEALAWFGLNCADELVSPRGFEKMLAVLLFRAKKVRTNGYTSSRDSPRQYFSSISSICASSIPK